jgi:hypothetical protein
MTRKDYLSDKLRNKFFRQLVSFMIPFGRVERLVRIEVKFLGLCTFRQCFGLDRLLWMLTSLFFHLFLESSLTFVYTSVVIVSTQLCAKEQGHAIDFAETSKRRSTRKNPLSRCCQLQSCGKTFLFDVGELVCDDPTEREEVQ